jgi:uncharacterized repeat protein (TIGR04052 family)
MRALDWRLISWAALACVASPSCASSDEQGATMDVEVQFAVQVNGAAFECGRAYPDIGTHKDAFTPRDLRFYVHELVFSDAEGKTHPLELVQDGKFQVDDIALLDFEGHTDACNEGTPEVNARVIGTLPEGEYRGLSFKLGLPFARNHADQTLAPSPLNLSGMYWTWQSGYKFFRFEGESPTVGGWIFHLGSTGCNGTLAGGVTECTAENVATVRLADHEPGHAVVLELGKLLSGSDFSTRPEGDVGCMADASDAECAPLFERLGLPVADKAASAQVAFHAQ